MPITVSEAMQLHSTSNFLLVAGQWGLENLIEKVGILEYEYIDNYEDFFGKGDFVISTFFFAKEDVNLLTGAVKSLIERRTSGLAIKSIYYSELPEEIITLANEKSYPIFIFHKDISFENIITDIMDAIRQADNHYLLEAKVDAIIRRNISKSMIRELALEINSSFKESFISIYCKDRKHWGDGSIVKLLERYNRSKKPDPYTTVFTYRNGILILSSFDPIREIPISSIIDTLLRRIGISEDRYSIGISDIHQQLNELDKGINECLHAYKVCKVSNKQRLLFRHLGLYKILLPYIEDERMNAFSQELLSPLKEYDDKYHTEMLPTAIAFVECDGNIRKTAELLIQHENTIRHRINKAKELLGMESLDGGFFEQLSIAVKIYKLYKSQN